MLCIGFYSPRFPVRAGTVWCRAPHQRYALPIKAGCLPLPSPNPYKSAVGHDCGRPLLTRGKGKEREVTLRGGVVGLIFDGRGRQPFGLPEDRTKRIAKLGEWNEALDIYPVLDAVRFGRPIATDPSA